MNIAINQCKNLCIILDKNYAKFDVNSRKKVFGHTKNGILY